MVESGRVQPVSTRRPTSPHHFSRLVSGQWPVDQWSAMGVRRLSGRRVRSGSGVRSGHDWERARGYFITGD